MLRNDRVWREADLHNDGQNAASMRVSVVRTFGATRGVD